MSLLAMSLLLLLFAFVLGEATETSKFLWRENHRHKPLVPKDEAAPGIADLLARQRKVSVVGRRFNATRVHGRSESGPSAAEMSCPTMTGGSCMVRSCDADRGKTTCGSGHGGWPWATADGNCVCAPGLCADGHGRCLEAKPATLLPGTFLIEAFNDHRNLYMSKVSSNTIPGWVGDPGKQGQWHIIVFNDGSIGITPEKWKYEYWMNVGENCDDGNEFHEHCKLEGHAEQQSAEDFTPYDVAWEVHAVEGQPEDVLCMRHIQKARFATFNYAYGKIDTAKDAVDECMLRFKPSLLEVMRQAKAQIALGKVDVTKVPEKSFWASDA